MKFRLILFFLFIGILPCLILRFGFLKAYEEACACDNAGVTLYIHMPTGEEEMIHNPNIHAKAQYIAKAYDDDLRLKSNPDIYIT